MDTPARNSLNSSSLLSLCVYDWHSFCLLNVFAKHTFSMVCVSLLEVGTHPNVVLCSELWQAATQQVRSNTRFLHRSFAVFDQR